PPPRRTPRVSTYDDRPRAVVSRCSGMFRPRARPETDMTRLLSSLLAAAGADARPFAVIPREHEPTLDVLVGEVVDVDRLGDIPLGDAEVLAFVPFRQVRERGFAGHDGWPPVGWL